MFPLTPDQHHWLEVATEDEGWCSFTSCTPSRSRARTQGCCGHYVFIRTVKQNFLNQHSQDVTFMYSFIQDKLTIFNKCFRPPLASASALHLVEAEATTALNSGYNSGLRPQAPTRIWVWSVNSFKHAAVLLYTVHNKENTTNAIQQIRFISIQSATIK